MTLAHQVMSKIIRITLDTDSRMLLIIMILLLGLRAVQASNKDCAIDSTELTSTSTISRSNSRGKAIIVDIKSVFRTVTLGSFREEVVLETPDIHHASLSSQPYEAPRKPSTTACGPKHSVRLPER